MKFRRILSTLLVLTMLLVCLPVQTHAEEQTASLTPKKFEQMKTITSLESGVYSFSTLDDLLELSNKAQNNPSKEYVCAYLEPSHFYITESMTIPENMAVVFLESNSYEIYVEKGVNVKLHGYMEVSRLVNKGNFFVLSTAVLYAKNCLNTTEGVLTNSGVIMADGGYPYGILGMNEIKNKNNGAVQLNSSFYNMEELMEICQQAQLRNNGHWFFALYSGNSYITWDAMTVTIPSNCVLTLNLPQKITNSEMVIYGCVDFAADITFSGNIQVCSGGMMGIGYDLTMQGDLENYGIITVVSGVDGWNGSLKMDNPQKYRDVNGSKRGSIIVAAKAGEEYPGKALVDMNVNSFTVNWYQEDGKSFWILTDYQNTLWVISGKLNDSIDWKLEGDVLTLSGTGKVTGTYGGTAPWYDVKEEVKKLVIEEGIADFGSAAFSLNRMTEIQIPDTVTRVPHNAFEKCHSLEEVTIPASVQEVGASLFYDSGVKTVYFTGDAPKFHAAAFDGVRFGGSEDLIVMYPAGNDTWTEEVRQDYGGNVTWIPYCEHDYETVITEVDCTTPGATSHICSKCGDTQVEPGWIPPQGHDYGLAEDGNPDFWDTTCDVCGAERVVDKHRPTHSMYRMYNPNSGEHFYTGSMEERKNLEAAGWKYEGVGFTFPATTGKPVYRLYDKFGTMEHLYTMDEEEKDKLLAEGWILEGIAFNSGREDEVPQYRLHNPNATIGAYHFTASEEERDTLIAAGWEYQGIGFYTCLQ